MPDLESIQPDEEGEEAESPSLENEKSQELDNATHEPGTRIEQTQSNEEAEVIESAFVKLMSDTADVPELPESELDALPHTAVGKGPVPGYSPKLSDTPKEAAPESSPASSEAVFDVLTNVLNDPEYRQQFFSNPEEALAEYELTQKERSALESLEEQNLTDFASESEEHTDLSDEDIKRLLGDV